jgi:Undecaprenyl-phosphate glucose phosphotransferase
MLQLHTTPSFPLDTSTTADSLSSSGTIGAIETIGALETLGRGPRSTLRKHFIPRDPLVLRALLAVCDLGIFVGVLVACEAVLARYGAAFASVVTTHHLVTGVLSFLVAHSLARSYDQEMLSRISRLSRFSFIVRPAALSCLAVAFSSVVETSLGTGAAAGLSQQLPQLYLMAAVTLAIALERTALYELLRRWQARGHLSTNVMIFGAGAIGKRLVQVLTKDYGDCVKISGIFDDRIERVPADLQGIAVGGGVEALLAAVKKDASIDKVLIALPMSAEKRILGLLARLRSVAVEVAVVPNFVDLKLDRQIVGKSHPPLFNLVRKPQSGIGWMLKRSFDITVSLALLTVLFPVLALTALAIKLDSPGPVLFRQPRLGFNNEAFHVLKFRSMYVNCADLEARQQTQRNDARVTRVGAWLRKSSIDELPQLINVLIGDMSLVGPRPHAIGMQVKDKLCDEIVRDYPLRHRVKPGITGWAQVRGLRGAVSEPEILEARVQHDIYYIDNWSFLFDLRILCMTIIELVRPRNAF